MIRKLTTLVFLVLFVFGCANTGPKISLDELKKLEDEVELEATRLYIDDCVRTWKVGLKILKAIPEDTIKKSGVIGALVIENSEDIAKYYGLAEEEGFVIIGLIDNFVASSAGIKQGDLVNNIDNKKVKDIDQVKFVAGRDTKIVIKRDGVEQVFKIIPEEMPYIRIEVEESGTINAYAKTDRVQFTTGMVHFLKDDDELAVVMGHELAHIISHHISKSIRMGTLCGIAGILTGPFAPLTFKSLYAPYGRNNEREADYLGLIYAEKAGYDIGKGVGLWKRFALELPETRSKSFLRSHPPSPERILRVKTVSEIIKSGEN